MHRTAPPLLCGTRLPRALAVVFVAALAAGCDPSEHTTGQGAVVTLLPRAPEEIDPRHVFDAYGLRVSRLLFASLVTIDPETLAAVPDLAEAITVESPTVYVARLRPGLTFADGTALDAADVVATFESVRDPKIGSRYARTYERIVRMEVRDRFTVAFHLDAPHAPFMTDLELPILPAEWRSRRIEAPPGRAGAHDTRDGIGAESGPYLLASRTASELVLVENRRWHHGRPRFGRLRLVVIRDDNTRAIRLSAAGGDFVMNAMPAILLPMFANTNFVLERAPGIGTTYIGLNLDAPRLGDVRVRRALLHAIDRPALVRAKLDGYGTLANGWIPPGHWASSTDVPAYPFDRDRAKRLLDEAGLPDPDGDGPKPRARIVLRTNTERSRVSVSNAVAAMWRDIGLDVDVQPIETASLLSDLGRGRFEAVLMTVPEVIEPHVLSWFFASDRIPGPGTEGANRWRLRNPALDAALERGRATSDLGARRAAYDDAQRILGQELPVLPLWHDDVVLVRRSAFPAVHVPRDARFGGVVR